MRLLGTTALECPHSGKATGEKRELGLKTPLVFSCYLHSCFSVRLLLSTTPKIISPSDVAAPLLHLGAALRRSDRSAPFQPRRCRVRNGEGWGGGERRYARVRASHRFLRGVLYRFLSRVVRWQAAFPGAGRRISGAFTDANAVPLEPGGWGWGERQGGDTCPHQPANAKHVSSPPSAPPRKKMGEICCISRGGACSTPTIPPKTHNL